MERQLAQSRNFEAQLSGRLNSATCARRAMSFCSRARGVRTCARFAERERLDARDSSLTRYANAMSYAALAQAKLGCDALAFELLEEAARYVSDDAETWNLSHPLCALGHPRRGISAARNAVATAKKLDLAVYSARARNGADRNRRDERTEQLLVTVTESLRSPKFAQLREDAARSESFEVYSPARGDVAAYVSLLNRAQLRLGALNENTRQCGSRAHAVPARARRLALTTSPRSPRWRVSHRATWSESSCTRRRSRRIPSHPR
jgi:hypothetical protein